MNLTLRRAEFRPDGVFGFLLDENKNQIAVTLEHAFSAKMSGLIYSAIPCGIYKCVRGTHTLDGHPPIETFEITKVPEHTSILFHMGNYNKDSEGCVLLGAEIISTPLGKMITKSVATFAQFMILQNGVNEFTLQVV